jgi:hypothetical protein
MGVIDHYDVKKGTLKWYLIMDDNTISNFPVYNYIKEPIYNHIGGDSPNISAGYEILYESKLSFNQLYPKIENYLKSNNYTLRKKNNPECYHLNLQEISNAQIYTSNGEGCLDLIFTKKSNDITEIRASIIY